MKKFFTTTFACVLGVLIAGILLTTAAAIALWLIDIKIGRKINSDKQNFIEDDTQ